METNVKTEIKLIKIIMLVLIEVLLIGAAILRLIKQPFDRIDIALISFAAIVIMIILALNYVENLKEDSLRQNNDYLNNENDRLIQINRALVTINRMQENQWRSGRQNRPAEEYQTAQWQTMNREFLSRLEQVQETENQ